MKAKFVLENISFKRSKPPIGLKSIYPKFDLFMEMHNIASTFKGTGDVSNIDWGKNGDDPFFSIIDTIDTFGFYLTRDEGITMYTITTDQFGNEFEQTPLYNIDIRLFKERTGLYNSYNEIKESYNFERNGNPRSSMGIGLSGKILDISYIAHNKGSISPLQDPRVIDNVLHGRDPLYQHYFAGVGKSWEEKGFYFGELMEKSNSYIYIRYKGKVYPIKGKVNESYRFERRLNPKISMGLGSLKKIDLNNIYQREWRFGDQWQFIADSYVNDNKELWDLRAYDLYNSPNTPIIIDTSINEQNENIEDVILEWINKNKIYESYGFERGKTIKDSLKLGAYSDKKTWPNDPAFIWNKETHKFDNRIFAHEENEESVIKYPEKDRLNHVKNETNIGRLVIWNKDESRWEYYDQLGLRESQNFERGKSPKEVMDLGIKVYKIDGLGLFDNKTREFSFDKRYSKNILSNKGIWSNDPFHSILAVQFRPDGSYHSLSLGYLAKSTDAYDYIEYDGELYPVPNPKNNINILKESINFERGKTVQDSINIGLGSKFKRFDEFLKYYNELKSRDFPVGKILTFNNSSEKSEEAAGFLIQDTDKSNDILIIDREKIYLQHIIKNSGGGINIALTPEINSIDQIFYHLGKYHN
ncbi:MAG: hypothetical protein M0R03_20405 [Novosphingobium sp.]|nr:hypothetical protein [Novosphingobium sp.]